MRKMFIVAGATIAMGSSLMGMNLKSDLQNFYNNLKIKGGDISIGIERVKIRNTPLKSTNVITLKYQKKDNLWTEFAPREGYEIGYGRMKIKDIGDDVSYLKMSMFKECGKDFKLKKGTINAYAGVKIGIKMIGGLNTKGIGAGPYVGAEYRLNKIGVGIHAGAEKDWFEGGNFFTETNVGADLYYSF